MESLEKLAISMVKKSTRYKQATLRSREYYALKAKEAGLTLTQYKEMIFSKKIHNMVSECIFDEKDDLIIFTDCWKAFGVTSNSNHFLHQRAKEGYLHKHDYFEIFYVLKGSCYNYIDNKEEIFYEGSFCLMNPQIIHERIIPDANSIIITICIRKTAFDTYLLNMLQKIPIFWNFFAAAATKKEPAYMHLHNTPNPHFESIIYQMMRAYLLDDSTSQILMKCNLIPLLTELARTQSIVDFQPVSCFLRFTPKKNIDLILENLRTNCESITLSELAHSMGYTPNYLSAIIKKNTGKTFQELVSHYWIEKAKILLKYTTFSINEIAEQMNASSRSNFERKFKMLTNSTPSQYRQQN